MPAPLVVAAASAAFPTLIDLGADLIDRLFPDPQEADKVKLELLKLERAGALAELESAKQLALAQMQINAVEATSPNVFVAGWRPAAGWAGVVGLVYATLAYPFLGWLSAVNQWAGPPALDNEILWLVLGTLLGVGGLRTIEKKAGVAAQ